MPTDSPRPPAITVSRLGFGTAPIGKLFEPISEQQAIETIQAAYAAGLRFFDTAPLYGTGLSEQRVGLALAGVPRDSFVLETKVGRLVTGRDQPIGQWEKGIRFDFSRDGVRRSLDESLQRLKLDHVDIALIHDPDLSPEHYQQVIDHAFPALAELREQGVVKAIGAGMNQWEMPAKFVQYADPDCFLLAGRYTLLEQTSLEFLELCRSKGIQIWLGGVFNSGILARGAGPGAKYQYAEAPEHIQAKVRRLQAVCDQHQVSLKVAALHFAAAHPAVKSLILGMESPAEVADNVQSWNAAVPAALWQDLRAQGLIEAGAPLPGGG
jgi:D-threo-aldose 1-dehydrogenase